MPAPQMTAHQVVGAKIPRIESQIILMILVEGFDFELHYKTQINEREDNKDRWCRLDGTGRGTFLSV